MDASEFAALFPGIGTKKGVTTSFSLSSEAVAETFGNLKISVPTWSRTHSFQKAYKTGSQSVSLLSAGEGRGARAGGEGGCRVHCAG